MQTGPHGLVAGECAPGFVIATASAMSTSGCWDVDENEPPVTGSNALRGRPRVAASRNA